MLELVLYFSGLQPDDMFEISVLRWDGDAFKLHALADKRLQFLDHLTGPDEILGIICAEFEAAARINHL